MYDTPFHSPLTRLHDPLFTEKQLQVFIKRDDLFHPYISGNKWRKLKYILAAAQEQQKTHLVTFGGAWSNHLLAVACAAATAGYKSTGFVRGEEVENLVMTLCRLFGMNLIFITREKYRDRQQLFDGRFSNDPSAFFIDEGGAGADGARGCEELIDELPENFDHIFCAAGTGTTAAGILNGTTKNKLPTLVHAVPVLKGVGYLETHIQGLLHRPAVFSVHSGYHFGGYACTTPELLNFIQKFSSTTGILPDPVYTGKLFYALYDLAGKNHFAPGEKVLLVHSGGLTGIAGKLHEFAAVLHDTGVKTVI